MKKIVVGLSLIGLLIPIAGWADRDDRQDKAITVIGGAVEVVADEVTALKRRVGALEVSRPRAFAPPASPSSATTTPSATMVADGISAQDVAEGFFIAGGVDESVARAAALTADRSAGRNALVAVGRKIRDRQDAVSQDLNRVDREQAATRFMLTRSVGIKKIKRLARQYGFQYGFSD